MPNIVVEIATITPVFSLRLNCIRIKNNNAKTINSNSQLFVGSKRNMIERGIIVPIPMPKYLYIFIPFFSSIVKKSYSPITIKNITAILKNHSTNMAAIIKVMSILELIILFTSIYPSKSSFSPLKFCNCLL